jgi:hypothetical protein
VFQVDFQPGDCAPYHEQYIKLVKDLDVVATLYDQRDTFAKLIASIPEEKANYAYAPGKWTIGQLLQHVIDTERIFTFRLLALSRGEQQPIPGFEQDEYVTAIDVTGRSLADQHKEFLSVRDAALTFVDSISQEESNRRGIVSGYPLLAGALPAIMAGHVEHHARILKERYL